MTWAISSTCSSGIPHDPATDFNGDGQLDPDDLGDFLNAFFAGC